jgi:hypothetical protein
VTLEEVTLFSQETAERSQFAARITIESATPEIRNQGGNFIFVAEEKTLCSWVCYVKVGHQGGTITDTPFNP